MSKFGMGVLANETMRVIVTYDNTVNRSSSPIIEKQKVLTCFLQIKHVHFPMEERCTKYSIQSLDQTP